MSHFTKHLKADSLVEPLAAAIQNALKNVEPQADRLVASASERETNAAAKWALEQIVENNRIARCSGAFACQDCGQAVLFVTLGQDLHVEGSLTKALNEAVALGYRDARKSVADPITRLNTGTNTPAVIHYDLTEGDALTVTYLSKGAGSENMSRLYMLTPSKGEQGIIDSAVDCMRQAGANPCPPVLLGIGVGGTMETCALLAKKALTRETGTPAVRDDLRQLEQKILAAVNALHIGAQGFGGDTTALSVAIEAAPTHIGMLPVAVNMQCHSVRHCTCTF